MIALSRYLVFSAKGVQSDSYPCPDWYALLAAATYLHCQPWDLLEQSIWWRDRAIIAMNAEQSARKSIEGH
jgi:hypothetical protein